MSGLEAAVNALSGNQIPELNAQAFSAEVSGANQPGPQLSQVAPDTISFDPRGDAQPPIEVMESQRPSIRDIFVGRAEVGSGGDGMGARVMDQLHAMEDRMSNLNENDPRAQQDSNAVEVVDASQMGNDASGEAQSGEAERNETQEEFGELLGHLEATFHHLVAFQMINKTANKSVGSMQKLMSGQ